MDNTYKEKNDAGIYEYEQILKILGKKFVFIREVARILSLSLTGKENVIFFGPGGHGKSEMVQTVINDLGLENDTFYQFFGEGMDEAKLFGGLNFQKLEQDKVLEYYPENSFLNKRIAVFEELFDAPASTLLSLKDVLTSKELRNGAQKFKMKTEVIIVLTNKPPAEISEIGPAAHALIERFSLQLDLHWNSYAAESYLKMFDRMSDILEGPSFKKNKHILAEVIAKAVAEGLTISPRTAVKAYKLCQTSAKLRGSDIVTLEDFKHLKFLPGLKKFGENIKNDLDLLEKKAEAQKKLSQINKKFLEISEEAVNIKTPVDLLKKAKELSSFVDTLSNVSFPDDLINQRNILSEQINKKISQLRSKAFDNTTI